jgi:hypothetical protein
MLWYVLQALPTLRMNGDSSKARLPCFLAKCLLQHYVCTVHDVVVLCAQDQCQHLLTSLKQVQQRLHEQQQQQQRQPPQQQQQARPSDPAMPITPTLAQAQAELQLMDCKRQLAEAKAALQEATAALQTEKAARLAAQDVEAGQQQLLQRIAGLQADSVELHGQLLAERKAAAVLREELSLTSTSRDTWRVSASGFLTCCFIEGCSWLQAGAKLHHAQQVPRATPAALAAVAGCNALEQDWVVTGL